MTEAKNGQGAFGRSIALKRAGYPGYIRAIHRDGTGAILDIREASPRDPFFVLMGDADARAHPSSVTLSTEWPTDFGKAVNLRSRWRKAIRGFHAKGERDA